jgi:hypothetical protein
MKITITIDTDNDAFDNADRYAVEISSILQGVIRHILDNPVPDYWGKALMDSNGNTVGHFEVEDA